MGASRVWAGFVSAFAILGASLSLEKSDAAWVGVYGFAEDGRGICFWGFCCVDLEKSDAACFGI